MSSLNRTKRLVYYADDDPDDLEFVRESFAQHASDIEVVTFLSAVELLEFLHLSDAEDPIPCLFILDINMPVLNGKEALKILRNMENYQGVPVVLFTTSNAPHDARFAEYHGAVFISKPLSNKQMDHIVEKFLEHCNEGVKSS